MGGDLFLFLTHIKSLVLSYLTSVPLFCPGSVNELYVDDPDKDSGGKIEVSLNISLPNLHCDCEYIHNIYTHTHTQLSISMHYTSCLYVLLLFFLKKLHNV